MIVRKTGRRIVRKARRSIAVGLIGSAVLVAGACSGDDEPLSDAQMPTTTAPDANVGLEKSPVVDVSEALSAIGIAETSDDFCDVAKALGAPLPTTSSPAVAEVYQRLAQLVESSTALVPDDDAFATFAQDWVNLGDALDTAAEAIDIAEGNISDPVFVAALRGDKATTAAETVERFRTERCG
ncbi:MAG: hypothetical protein GX868_06700 [Actinobacteria bacterium]|nr:hypothetical protein [Actinomycetota bacterium]